MRLLPVLLFAAALIMVIAGVALSLPVTIGALLLWRLPRWSIDSTARQAAQATIPDERRARTSFLIDLVPMATGLIAVAIPIVITLGTHQRWVAPIFAVVFGMGVVSGVVMSYQFGTNWPVFADKVGPVLGPLVGGWLRSARSASLLVPVGPVPGYG